MKLALLVPGDPPGGEAQAAVQLARRPCADHDLDADVLAGGQATGRRAEAA
jgi:hypothetical protein